MRRAGCYRVAFGLESGDDAVLRGFGKGGRATLASARTAVEQCRAAGIEVSGYFMIGLSGDTEESMRRTIDHPARRCDHRSSRRPAGSVRRPPHFDTWGARL